MPDSTWSSGIQSYRGSEVGRPVVLCGFLEKQAPEVLVTGIHEDASQADDIPLLTIDDVTFAILNYTYGANTETLPLDLLGI